MNLSIIICTRNRAPALRETLKALGRMRVPPAWRTEVLVVDNVSTDETPAIVNSARLDNLEVRYIYEPKPGQSNARNTGMAVAQGEIILFTDDDVVPEADWLERLVTPLLEKKCDAVVGTIRLAEHLRRSWMKPVHKLWLAAPDMPCDREVELIGANMGFHRSVLERVPAFDRELGPGALGFGDDSLFSFQLCAADFRLRSVPEAVVVHHLEPARLLRSQWLDASRKRGRSTAYLLHHWHHNELKFPLLRSYYLAAKLHLRRILQPPIPMDAEGCAPWEISYVGSIEMCRHFITERKRPRNYAKKGLARLDFQREPSVPAEKLARDA